MQASLFLFYIPPGDTDARSGMRTTASSSYNMLAVLWHLYPAPRSPTLISSPPRLPLFSDQVLKCLLVSKYLLIDIVDFNIQITHLWISTLPLTISSWQPLLSLIIFIPIKQKHNLGRVAEALGTLHFIHPALMNLNHRAWFWLLYMIFVVFLVFAIFNNQFNLARYSTSSKFTVYSIFVDMPI